MARADVAAGKAYVSLYVKQGDLAKGLNKAKKELQDFGSGIAKVGAGVFAMGTTITGSLAGAVMHFANVGGALDDMSQRTGMSVAALVELGHAADMGGTDMATFEGAIGKMQKQLGAAGPEGKKLTETLAQIGLTTADLLNLSPDEQFSKIAAGIREIGDPAQKSAAAMAIFGKSGAQLIPMINDMEKFRQEARDLGLAPSPESVAAAAEIGDAIDRVRKVAAATIFEIGAAVAPMAADVLSGFLQMAAAVRKFMAANKGLIVTVAKIGVILSAVGAAVLAIGTGFIAAGLAISGVMSVAAAFSASIALVGTLLSAAGAAIAVVLSPVGLLVAALVGGAIAWAKFTNSGQAAVGTLVGSVTTLFGNLSRAVTDTFGGIIEAIRGGDLALAGQIAMVGLRLAVTMGLEAIHGLFGETIGTLVSQIATGDLAGAWATLGSTILASMAGVANGLLNMFTAATNGIIGKWRSMVDELTNDILQQAGEGGVFGAAFTAISGVNVKEEMQRAQSLEAARRAKGLNPQDDDIASQIAAGTYRDPSIAAIEAQALAATAAVSSASQGMADATQAAVDDATAGQSKATSDSVKKLEDELASLRSQAAAKIAAGADGTADAAAAAAAGGGASAGTMGGRASVASNNLMALAAMASSPQDRQVRIGEQQLKKADKQLEKMDLQFLAIEKLGLFHA